MTNRKFWKVALGLSISCLAATVHAQVGSLSEGACWYENKESIRVASFNDRTVYNGTRAQVETEMENLLSQKISDMDLALHCGGYGASLVARVSTENGSYCLWTRFEKGKLQARSIGAVSEKAAEGTLCDGHKVGEFILGVNSKEFISELQGSKWASLIKSVIPVTDKIYKVVVTKEYEMKETEVALQLEENFTGKDFIRYIEFNEYRHPIGEYVQIK